MTLNDDTYFFLFIVTHIVTQSSVVMMPHTALLLAVVLLYPSLAIAQLWVKISGNDCASITEGGTCLQSKYINNRNCKYKVTAPTKLIVHNFVTESGYDWVYVKGNRYTGSSNPNNVQLQTNDQLQWYTDYSVTRSGFKICGNPSCSNTDSSGLNPASCLCGTSTCSDSTGLYCQASSSTCFACLPGFARYQSASCSACSSGKYQDELGLIAGTCKICTGGKYNDLTTGVTACKNCDTGKSSSDSGVTLESQCQDCVAGKYNDLTGAAECKNCVAGSWSDGIGIASSALCKDCPVGKWSSSIGRDTSCISCSIGFYNPEVKRAQDCIVCSKGQYQDQEATTACSRCAAGKNNLLYASTSDDACIDCPVGTYNDLTGHGDDCAQCAANAEAGLTTCSGCGPGEREREHSYFSTYFILRLRNSDTNFLPCFFFPSFFFQRQIQRSSRNLCRLCTWEIFGHNGPCFMSFLSERLLRQRPDGYCRCDTTTLRFVSEMFHRKIWSSSASVK